MTCILHGCIREYYSILLSVCQAVEFHTVNHAFPVLQEIDIIGQVLYIISIPQANVVIANYEYLMPVRQVHIPINEVEHLALLTIIADVTAMHDNISLRQVIKLMVSAVSVRYMYDFHLCCSDIYWQLY